MATRIASTQIDLLDLNDAIIAGSAPSNPVEGTLWIDNSVSPPVLKIYHNGAWGTQQLDLSYLDPTADQSITDSAQKLSDMANDLVLTKMERLDVKNIVTNMIGSIPTDAGTLPALSSIDSASTTYKGEVWAARRSALAVALPTDSSSAYGVYGTAYTTLINYMNSLTPKPWDITSTNNTTLTSAWRTNWNSYYTAYNALVQAVDSKLGTGPVGGRNYLRNTGAFSDNGSLTNWSLNVGSACVATLNVSSDATYGNVLDVTVTTNSATGNNWIVLQNTGLTLPNGTFVVGNTYTLNFYIKNAMAMYVNFKDADGTDPVIATNYSIPASATWRQVVWTFTATATGVTPEFYLRVNDTAATGDIYLTYVMLEDGTRPSGWSPAPEDTSTSLITLSSRVTTVENDTTADAVVLAVTTSQTYKTDLQGKAPADVADGLASTDYADNVGTAAKQYTDDQIKGLTMTDYVKHADMIVYEQDVTATFKSSGGINMLQNSIGLSGSDFWSVTGTFGTTFTPDLQPFGLKSGFALDGCTLKQNVPVTPGITYTLSARIFKDTTGTGYIKIYDTVQVSGSQSNIVNFISGSKYALGTKQSIDITPTSGSVTVELYADATVTTPMIFSGVMLNIGAVAFEWSDYPFESYSGTVNMDLNGIRVAQTDATGKITRYTVMTPSKFAGYADADGNGVIDQTTGSPDEVFRMDADSFVMKAAYIKPIKMIPVTSGGYNGIAFVGV